MIAFEDVWCTRGDTAVLRGLTIAIDRGETIALVGRSGAGKSTALKLINRMILPDRGRVTVAGNDTRDADPVALRRQTGYMLQEVGLFPHMSVERNVGLIPALLDWAPSRIANRTRHLLDLVGLPSATYAARWPDELSGGQRQRVGVARALAAEPPVVLMDEPFGALDPVTRAELHDVVRRVREETRPAIVLVTHDMGEAFALADRVGVLHDGHLVACDTPAAIQQSTHPAVRVLLDAADVGRAL